MHEFWPEDRKRFASVMAARKSSAELIALFDKLAESDKFPIASKPYCFADLVEVCAQRVPASALDALLEAISLSWTGDILWRLYPEREVFTRVGPLLKKVVDASTKAEVLERRLYALRSGGVIKTLSQVVVIADHAGLAAEKLVQLRADVAAIEARPPAVMECPF